MLMIERQAGDSIFIGPDIRILITRVRPGGRIRIGVEAPKNVRILRSPNRSQLASAVARAHDAETRGRPAE